MKIKNTKFRILNLSRKKHLDTRGGFREIFLQNRVKVFSGFFGVCQNQKKMS